MTHALSASQARPERTRILFVANDSTETSTLEQALTEGNRPFYLRILGSGEEACDYLNHCGTPDGLACPDLILIDLDLAGLDGPGLLRFIKRRPETAHVPVILLSSSMPAAAVRAAYDSYASCFITKPATDGDRERVARAIQSFWFESATLPRNSAL